MTATTENAEIAEFKKTAGRKRPDEKVQSAAINQSIIYNFNIF